MKKVFNPKKKFWSSLIKRPLYNLDYVKDIVEKKIKIDMHDIVEKAIKNGFTF